MIVLMMAHNRKDVLADALASVLAATERAPIWVLDNGSQQDMRGLGAPVVKLLDNIGNYRGFVEALHFAEAMNQEIVAVLHSDFYIWERGWDRRVEEAFSGDPLLGLVGFAASHQVDGSGGRGLGTVTNYQGRAPRWSSKAEVHGRRFTGFMAAAQVDGCSMVFRTETLRGIGLRSDFPPHHWYDRLMSCQVLEMGQRVGFLGIECDHPGGTTTMFEQTYHDLCRRWCEEHGVSDAEQSGNWDLAIYRAGERAFLSEYRDQKHFIPLHVEQDWSVHHG